MSAETPNRRERREAKRLQPLGADGLEAVRKIVSEHQAAKVNEVLIDATTANVIVKVHDALSEANRAKLLDLPVGACAALCFKLLK